MSRLGSRSLKNLARAGGLVLLLAAGAVTLTPTAGAAESAVVNTAGSYCAYSAVTDRMACVNDEKDYPAAKSAALGTDSTSASPATQYLMGRFFDDDQFSTAHGYIDWFAGAACTASTSNVDSGWIDTTSWRSRISSFRGYSGCRIKAWESTGYTGSSLPYLSSRSNVGVLNDHIWSAQFT